MMTYSAFQRVLNLFRSSADDDVGPRGIARGVPQTRLARGRFPHARKERALQRQL